MKVVTWNINGIRATSQSLKALLDSLDADIICLQETKITREMQTPSTALVDGYNAYFSYSRKRAGYSGVVNYCRDSVRPIAAEEGLSGYLATANGKDCPADVVGCYGDLNDLPVTELRDLDGEGRAVITEHQFRETDGKLSSVCVINVYCPRADKERDDRKAYKEYFCKCLQKRAEALLVAGKHVIIVGDLNTSHRPIDTCDSSGKDWAQNPCRLWLNGLLLDHMLPVSVGILSSADGIPQEYPNAVEFSTESPIVSGKFTDVYRYFHPTDKYAYTCWSTSTGARQNNYGCRIDYIIADNDLVKGYFAGCAVSAEIRGSDHCPVNGTLNIECIPAEKCPSLCTKYMPEFQGKQQTLHSFFRNKTAAEQPQVPAAKKLRLTETVIITKKPVKWKSVDTTKIKGQKSLADFFRKKDTSFVIKESFDTVSSSPARETEVLSLSQKSESASTQSSSVSTVSDSDDAAATAQWRKLLRGPQPAPQCSCGQTSILKKVNKPGPNKGKQFYMCPKPEGIPGDPNARCNYFKWIGGPATAKSNVGQKDDLRP